MLPRSLLVASLVLLAVVPRGQAEPLLQIEHNTRIHCLAWSADGKTLATGAEARGIRLIDIPSGKLRTTIQTGYTVSGIAFAPDSKTIAIRQVGQDMSIWNVATGQQERSGGLPDKACKLAFTRDGKLVVAAGHGEMVFWGISPGVGTFVWGSLGGAFAAVAADGSIVGWGDADGEVTMRLSQPRQMSNLQVGPAQCMAFGPAAKTLAIGGGDKNIYLWSLTKRDKTATLTGLQSPAKELSYAADGSALAALTADGKQIRIWDLARLRTRRLLSNTRGTVTALELSPDSRYLATLGSDGKVLVWNVATRELDKGPKLQLSTEELTALWKDLGHVDFAKADAAWRRLTSCGDNVVPFLKEKIKPISVPLSDPKRIEQWINQLDHDKFAVRENANKELLALGGLVITPLQKMLANRPSEEARCRADKILKKVNEPVLTPERLQVLDAIELLEMLHTPAAKQLLEEIARDTLIVQFRQDALFALERLLEAQAQDEKLRSLKKQAQEVVNAMSKDDHEKLADLTHPKVVELLGGRKKMIQGLELLAKQIRSQWPTITLKLDEPKQIAESKGEWFGIVSFTMELQGKGLRGTMQSFLIGVSEDEGKRWVFVDAGNKSYDQIKELLANFPKELRLPELQKPKFEKVD
jgi:WD40 repeat protein